jgi:hypothetical protein
MADAEDDDVFFNTNNQEEREKAMAQMRKMFGPDMVDRTLRQGGVSSLIVGAAGEPVGYSKRRRVRRFMGLC